MKLRTWRYKALVRRAVLEASYGYMLFSTRDPEAWKSQFEDLGRLCADAWHDDLPEEDREWAEAHREKFRRWVDNARPNGVDPRVNPGSLQGSHGIFHGASTPPWAMLIEAVKRAGVAFVEAFPKAPAGGERAYDG